MVSSAKIYGYCKYLGMISGMPLAYLHFRTRIRTRTLLGLLYHEEIPHWHEEIPHWFRFRLRCPD